MGGTSESGKKLLNNNNKNAASQLKTTGDAQHVNVD